MSSPLPNAKPSKINDGPIVRQSEGGFGSAEGGIEKHYTEIAWPVPDHLQTNSYRPLTNSDILPLTLALFTTAFYMKLLLIEDDQALARSLVQGLRKNWIVEVADSGEMGIFRAETAEYDAIVLDLGLPDCTGLDVCDELRKLQINTPILVLTGEKEIEKKILALDLGADDYLTKPFHQAELQARLRALTRRARTLEPSVFSAQGLELDCAEHSVRFHGTPLQLRRQEYLLLEYLLKHRGQVVTRLLLSEQAWPDAKTPENNAIEVNIKRLREKIGPEGKRVIKTVRGFGYMIPKD